MRNTPLKNNETNFIALLNFIVDPAVIVDEKGNFLIINDAFMDLTGLSKKELIGTSFLNAKILTAESKVTLLKNLKKRMQGLPVEPYEISFTDKTGKIRYAEVKAKKIDRADQVVDLVIVRDITRRKENARRLKKYSEKMEALVNEKVQEIKKSEETYRELINGMNDTVWVIDFDSNFIDVNDAAVRALGYSREELLSMGPQDIDDSLDAEQIKHFVEQAPTAHIQVLETEHTTKDGRKIPVEISSSLVTYQGKPAFLSIARDITERKKAEEALKISEEKYRELINGMNDTAWVIDFNGNFVDVNDAAVKVLGYSREELLRMGPLDIDDSLTKEQIKDLIRSMPADQVQVFETAHTTKDGKTIPVEISSSLVTYQGKQAILSIARDITERKKVEEALRKSEERFRQVAKNSQEWIWEVDAQGLYTYASPVVEKILGYKPEEIVGKKHFYDLFHPEDREELKEAAFKVFAQKQAFREFVNRTVHKKGKLVWLSTGGIPTLDKKGNLLGYRGADIDITERKEAEQAILRSKTEWKRTFDSVPDLIAILDDQHRIVRVNQAMAQRLGVAPEQCIGLKCYEPVHGTDAPPEFCPHVKTLQDGQEHIAEVHEERLGGDFLVSTTPLNDEHGHMIGSVHVARDITERKKSEEALKESEEKFRNLSEESPNMIFINKQGKVVYANKKCEDIMGYTKEEFYAPTFNFLSLIAPDSLEKVKLIYSRHRTGEEVAPYEYDLVTKAGKRISAVITTKLIKYEGEPALLGIITDITERKQLENALRESEEMFRAISTSAMDAIILLNDKAKIMYWNPAAERIFGYTNEEAVGKKLDNLIIPPQYHGIHSKATINNYKKGYNHKKTLENKALRKNGTEVPIELSIAPLVIKDKKHMLGIVRDISQRKKMEDALKQERDMLEAATANIGAGLAIISNDYRILWANKILKNFIGDCEGKSCYVKLGRSEDVCSNCGVKKVFENRAQFDRHDWSYKDAKGSTEWVELIATPIKDKEGNIVAALELVVNATKRKQMQNQLAEYSQKLEKLVEQRTKQLKKTQAKLVKSERLATIGELAAMVGHDLRNPLTGIMGAAYYLKTKHRTELGAKGKEMLETIERAINHSNKIINDLLEYSRDLKLKLTETTPKAMLQRAVSLLEVPENIQVVDATEDKPVVKADTEKMPQVFVNITQNAVDAMPEGGTLTIKSREIKDKLEIAFTDTGTGMSEKTLRKLKKGVPLFTTKAKGMGFGLPISRRIAEAHGGKITVESKIGKGTTVTVTIPVNPKPVDTGEEKWLFNESMLSAITATQKKHKR